MLSKTKTVQNLQINPKSSAVQFDRVNAGESELDEPDSLEDTLVKLHLVISRVSNGVVF